MANAATRLTSVVGIVSGTAAGIVLSIVVASAVAQSAEPQAVLEATHLPPLLTMEDEPVDLTYDVDRTAAAVEDPEQPCAASGTVFVRTSRLEGYRPYPLE